ncbi:metallophosphoesterase [Sediminitomix flava]|uniref:Calcineurin-like phosphoesterase domain-containing protein n=1 Tax=Sediminitomix flava TaxID=379075 RepID=A0A315Z6A8_SEDFL|nr:metallophosphoesterase [Sediminitomix flava]PWJ37901.1 hypothetical protein BC781_10836 [Sediminitomix flava]
MKKLTRRQFIKGGSLASLGLLVLDAFWIEHFFIEWNTFNISNSKDTPIRLLQISDLHLKTIKYQHKRLAKKINENKPDLLFFTGDSIDHNDNLMLFDEFLGLISEDIPKYAITGNWEYWGDVNLEELKTIYHKNNCKLLINEHETIQLYERKISIIGVDDYVGGDPNLRDAIEGITDSDYNIVLAHCPGYKEVIQKYASRLKTDLVLSGHTHGGQLSFFGFVPFKPQGSGHYLKGWYTKSEPKMYVSKGIGTSILPIRFGARSELVEILI